MAGVTQEEIDSLEKSYRKGVLEVEYDGERVKFRSRADMLATINQMKRELSGVGLTSSSRRSYPEFTKGV